MSEDIEEISQKRICARCIEEDFLSAEVRKDGERAECDYCTHTRKTISIEELSDRVDLCFEQHYVRTPSEPSAFEYAMSKESNWGLLNSVWVRLHAG